MNSNPAPGAGPKPHLYRTRTGRWFCTSHGNEAIGTGFSAASAWADWEIMAANRQWVYSTFLQGKSAMNSDHAPFTYVPPPKTTAPKPGRHWAFVIAPYVAGPALLVAALVWWVR